MKKVYLILILSCFINIANAQWLATSLIVNTKSLLVNGNNIFAGSNGNGAYMSSDNGSTWIFKGPAGVNMWSMAMKGDTLFAGDQSCGLYYTIDNGDTWNLCLSTVYDVYAILVKGNNIYTATYDYGLFLSSDGAVTWTSVNNGLPDLSNMSVGAFALKEDIIFAAAGTHGVYISTNNGELWTEANSGLSGYGLYVFSFGIKGNTIFIATGAGVYYSTNNAGSWNPLPLSDCNSFSFKGDTIFAATYNGVFMSLNNGNNWLPINSGLTDLIVYTIAIKGDTLFAGTYDGVFRLPLSELTSIKEISNNENNISIYPNPAIDDITIATKQKSEIEILNIEGQLIKSLTANESKTTIDVSDFANGMYFVKVKTEDGIAVKKFIKE